MIRLGISLIICGTIIMYKARFHNLAGLHFDLTGYNIPVGLFMVFVGIACLWKTWKDKHKIS